MGQARPLRAKALVVEDDPIQREMIGLLLEESDFDVIACESAEAAELVLQRSGGNLDLMMTDVNLAGTMDGVALAHIARRCNPDIDVIVTSGKPLPQPLPDRSKILVQAMDAARCDPRGGANAVRPRFCALGPGPTPGGPSRSDDPKSKGGLRARRFEMR